MSNFRDRMRVGTSNAEHAVLIELQLRHLVKHMHALGTVIVFVDGKAEICKREEVTYDLLRKTNGFTIPDFPFLKVKLPVYLDGPPHLKRGVMRRDAVLNAKLEAGGMTPLRFAFTPTGAYGISATRLKEVCDQIEAEVKKRMGSMREVN